MGGKAFPDIIPIPHDVKYKIYADVIEGINFPVEIVGSARNRRDFYNDLDIAVEMSKDVWEGWFQKEFVPSYTTDSRIISPNCVSTKWKHGDSFYQIDFLQSKNLKFSLEMYWSHDRSIYKGAHRNILIAAIINLASIREWSFGDILIRTKKHLDPYNGLVYMVQQKKRSSVRYTTLDRQLLIDDSFTAILQHFHEDIHWYDLASWETLYAFLNEKYKDNPDMLKELMREAGNIIKTTKLEMPQDVKNWVSDFD